MYLDEWRYLKREKPDPEIVDPRPVADADHRSHTIVEQWFVRLLAAGYVSVGGYAGGFIFTPLAKDFIPSLPAPSIVGFTTGGIFLIGVGILFMIQDS
jgi:ABC-type enterobactin transport system permease subunit